MIDPEIHELAIVVLTERQLHIWQLAQTGMSQRTVAYTLDLSRTTVTDTLDAAHRKLRAHGVQVTPDGRPYLTQQEPA
jgi:DNA-binding CsgD family transcriptional regulator